MTTSSHHQLPFHQDLFKEIKTLQKNILKTTTQDEFIASIDVGPSILHQNNNNSPPLQFIGTTAIFLPIPRIPWEKITNDDESYNNPYDYGTTAELRSCVENAIDLNKETMQIVLTKVHDLILNSTCNNGNDNDIDSSTSSSSPFLQFISWLHSNWFAFRDFIHQEHLCDLVVALFCHSSGLSSIRVMNLLLSHCCFETFQHLSAVRMSPALYSCIFQKIEEETNKPNCIDFSGTVQLATTNNNGGGGGVTFLESAFTFLGHKQDDLYEFSKNREVEGDLLNTFLYFSGAEDTAKIFAAALEKTEVVESTRDRDELIRMLVNILNRGKWVRDVYLKFDVIRKWYEDEYLGADSRRKYFNFDVITLFVALCVIGFAWYFYR